MRKLLIALALVPAISHAALLIDGAKPQPAAANQDAQPNAVVVANGTVPADATHIAPASAVAMSSIRITPVSELWSTTPTDGNMRLLVAKMAKREGWDFSYDVDQDVPITGHDSFSGSFKAAVRHVLRTTEMTSYRIKPCFYTNNLVRVVKDTTKCDPSM